MNDIEWYPRLKKTLIGRIVIRIMNTEQWLLINLNRIYTNTVGGCLLDLIKVNVMNLQ